MDTTQMKKAYDTVGLQHGETWYAWIARGNTIRMVDLRNGKPHTRKYDNTGRNIETTDSSIGYILSPGTKDGRDEQHAIWHLVRCLGVFGHGRVPITETSHSLRKALDAEIVYCREIGLPHRAVAAYKRALDDFMDVAYYVQTPYLNDADFASELEGKAQVLVDARHALSVAADEEDASSKPATRDEIENILKPIKTKQDVALASITDTNKIVKRIDNRERKAQRKQKARYSDDQLNAIHTLWLKAQDNPSVKLESSRRPNYDAALKYYMKEFAALGIYTAAQLRNALKAWSQRASRTK